MNIILYIWAAAFVLPETSSVAFFFVKTAGLVAIKIWLNFLQHALQKDQVALQQDQTAL